MKHCVHLCDSLITEQIVQLKINPVYNQRKIFDARHIVEVVNVEDQQLAVFVGGDPLLVMFIQVLQVFELDVEFEIPVPFRDLLNKFWDIGSQIDQKIRRLHEIDHGIVDVEITLVVAIVDVAAGVEVSCEDVCVFVYRAILYDRSTTLADLAHLVETAIQKIYLQMKRPLRHVAIEIAQVWVLIHRFIQGSPSVVLRKLLGESALTRTNVARDGDVLDLFQRGSKIANLSRIAQAPRKNNRKSSS